MCLENTSNPRSNEKRRGGYRETAKYGEGVIVYRGDPATCTACPIKAGCTTSNHGRIVHRSLYAEYLDRVKSDHETPAYQKAMGKRNVWIEPLFAEAKDWHGRRRFRLRGLVKVNSRAQLIAAGQSLKRLLRKTGWGRRSWPGGAVGVVRPRPLRVMIASH
jgi:hypothetical protein